jgi:Leucine-rich repeat (LRR) protein
MEVNPKTGRLIKTNGITYKKLLDEGYFKNKMSLLPDEIIQEIIYEMNDINDILSICSSDNRIRSICDNVWEVVYWKFYGDADMNTLNLTYKEMIRLSHELLILINNLNLKMSIRDLYLLDKLILKYCKIPILPKEIGILINLKVLDLLDYGCIKLLPKEIGQLINLKILYLSNNKLIKLPKEIGNLINLKKLYLDENELTKLPKEIGNLINLKILEIDYNKLTSLPKEIGQLENLKRLSLSFNKLKYLPVEINNLKNLETLKVSDNFLTFIPTLSNLKNLEFLDINNNKITSVINQISSLKNLEWLLIKTNPITKNEIININKLNIEYVI